MSSELSRLSRFIQDLTNEAANMWTNVIVASLLPNTVQDRHRFHIPVDFDLGAASLKSAGYAMILGYVFPIVDRTFPRGSWPWTLAREICFYYQLYGKPDEAYEDFKLASNRELGRVYQEKRLAALGQFALARITSYDRDTSSKIARLGLKNLSDEAFLRDAKLLTDGDSSLAKLCRGAVEQLWQLSLEDQASVLSALPAEAPRTGRATH